MAALNPSSELPPTAEELADIEHRVRPDDLEFTFTRATGPGGQNVNKVNTRVTLLFDLDGATLFTDAERRCIRSRLPGRVARDGRIRVVSSRHRTQRANRSAALDRLFELLAVALRRRKTRKPTRPSASAKRRRLDQKRLVSEKKRQRRGRVTGPDGW